MGRQIMLSGDNTRLFVDDKCVETFKKAGYRLLDEVQATEEEKPKRKKKSTEEVTEDV